MTGLHLLYSALIALSTAGYSLQQGRDPVADFCRRFGHQTTVIDQKLYIDESGFSPSNMPFENFAVVEERGRASKSFVNKIAGGEVVWNSDSSKSNQTNKWLLYNDLEDIENDMPQLKSGLSKDATVPLVSGGVLWSDVGNKTFYAFGGEFAELDHVEASSLWRYDIASDRWNLPNDPPDGIPARLSWGAGTTIQDRSEGYLYGGWQNNLTTPDWGDRSPQASSRILKYFIDDNRWTNITGPDDIGRAEGSLLYLPASDDGLLIYFGGVLDAYRNGTFSGANMSEIHVYDVVSQKWYSQIATGEAPESRGRFCAGVVPAPDQSSYNVYMYGGLSPTGSAFDDVYVLSLPSFRWIKWWSADLGKGHPHHSLSCNVVNNAQMIIIGGSFPLEPDFCDAPTIWGTHNLKLGGGNDWIEWAPFNETLKDYLVPSNITEVIGGGPTGGATLTAPPSWSDDDLRVYFTKKVTPSPTPTPTTSTAPPASSRPKTGTIVGAAVGSAAALAALLFLAWYLRRRHIRKQADPKPSNDSTPPELPTYPAQFVSTPPMQVYHYAGSPVGAGGMYVMPSELDSPRHDRDRKPGGYAEPNLMAHPSRASERSLRGRAERESEGNHMLGGVVGYELGTPVGSGAYEEYGSTLRTGSGGYGDTLRSASGTGTVGSQGVLEVQNPGQWVWHGPAPGSPGLR